MWYLVVDFTFGSRYVQMNAESYIPYICDKLQTYLDKGSTNAEAFKQLLQYVVYSWNNGCTVGGETGAYKEYINGVSDTTMDVNGTRSDRQWWYLQCAHIGWHHTCQAGGLCPFTPSGLAFDALPLSWYEILCNNTFGLTAGSNFAGVESLLNRYGGQSMESSNVLAINGQDDPWHLLGLLPPTDATNIEDDDEGKPMRVLVPGAWHCADTNAPAPTDPPELPKARARAKQQVRNWLAPNSPTPTLTLSPTLVNSPTANGRSNTFVGILGQSSTLSPVDQTILFAFIIFALAGLLFLLITFTIRRLRLWGKTPSFPPTPLFFVIEHFDNFNHGLLLKENESV
jgi:hypothetical protein